MRHNLEHPALEGWDHFPVMWREAVEFAGPVFSEGKGLLVDSTLGEGGHSALFLSEFPGIRVAAIERDPYILERAEERLTPYEGRVSFYNCNFSEIGEILDGVEPPLCILFDLGISTYHYEKSGRGFGFSRDENLDMRLDETGVRASDIINNYPERDIADIIFRYGEERWGRRISKAICMARSEKLIETTGELAEIVLRAIPKRFHSRNIHPATRVFQALRIASNSELEAIEKGLSDAFEILASGGRIIAISFHSLEDRIVKKSFRAFASGCVCGRDGKRCVCGMKPRGKVLTGKPVLPGEDEVAANSRSRSAKMRCCEKF